MPRITLDAVATAMDGLYETAFDPARLPQVLDTLRELFRGSKACLVRQGPDLHPTDAVSTGSDMAFVRQYLDEFSQEPNVLVAKVSTVPVGVVYRDHELVGRERLRASRIWNEWMRPQDMYGGLACKLVAIGDSCWFFDVQRGRGQPDFDDDEAAALRWLKPALTHVVGLRSRIGALKLERDLGRCALDALAVGIAVVDGESRVVYANEAAEQLIHRVDGPFDGSAGRIVVRDLTRRAALQRLIAWACRGPAGPAVGPGTMLVDAPDGTIRPAVLHVTPLRAPPAYGLPERPSMALVFIRELDGGASLKNQAIALFGLTETEARFASALAAGQSLAEAARQHGVRISTARTHLARIFQKTGVRQQSQLAALVRGLQLPVR